jgi:hypothetical protein
MFNLIYYIPYISIIQTFLSFWQATGCIDMFMVFKYLYTTIWRLISTIYHICKGIYYIRLNIPPFKGQLFDHLSVYIYDPLESSIHKYVLRVEFMTCWTSFDDYQFIYTRLTPTFSNFLWTIYITIVHQ